MWGIIATIVGIAVAASVLTPRSLVADRRLLVGAAVTTAVLLIQTVLVVYAVKATSAPPDWTSPRLIANIGFAIEIGLLVGATEMIARYRDEPFAPLLSTPGALYILINGGASALAYYLLVLLDVDISEPLRTFAAGVAAMAFFRSALFNVRIGGADVPVGPNLILLTILKALDRAYDRERASPRSKIVRRIVGRLSFENIKNSLPALCFDLMQNLSSDETTAINTQVTQLSQSTAMDDQSKTLSLGLALLDLVGESTLQAAVNALGTFREVDRNLLLKLAVVKPGVVLSTLPKVCATLYEATPHDDSQPAFVPAPLADDLSMDSQVVLLVYQLVNYYGAQLVGVAANLVEASALSRPTPSPGGNAPGPVTPGPVTPLPDGSGANLTPPVQPGADEGGG